MKISAKRRFYKHKTSIPLGWVFNYIVPVRSKAQLPCIGHKRTLYVVSGTTEKYMWANGKWFVPTSLIGQVHPPSRSLRELEAQPAFKHVTNLPIMGLLDVSKIS